MGPAAAVAARRPAAWRAVAGPPHRDPRHPRERAGIPWRDPLGKAYAAARRRRSADAFCAGPVRSPNSRPQFVGFPITPTIFPRSLWFVFAQIAIRLAGENRASLVEREPKSAGASRRLHPHRRPAMGGRGADRRHRRSVEVTPLSESGVCGDPRRRMAGWSSGVAGTGALTAGHQEHSWQTSRPSGSAAS